MMRHAHAFYPLRMAAPVTKRVATMAGPPLPDQDSTPLFGQELTDKIPLILFDYDLYAQQLMHCNRHFHTILGYESQELIKWGSHLMTKLLYADSRFQLTLGKWQEQLANDRPLGWDCHVRHHSDNRRWLRIRVQAGECAPDGQAREIISSAENVTNHHDTAEELCQNRYLLRQVLDLVPNLVCVYELQLQCNTYVNLRIEQLLGGVLRVNSEVGVGSTFAFTLTFQPVPVETSPLPAAPMSILAVSESGRFLLVEDNLVNGLLAETILRNWGGQMNTVASGPVAIQLFEHRPFDLVLMDVQMPGMNGETVACVLRRYPDPIRVATPVITLTDRARGGEAKRLHATSFDGYLAKPYREEQLLLSTQTVLHSRNLVSELTSPCPSPTAVPTGTPLYDSSNAHQLVHQDEAIIRRLVRAFIETTPAILTALDKALTLAEYQGVGDAAHHLKGFLDSLDAESPRRIIREVAACGGTLPTPTHAAHQVARVRTTTKRLMANLRRGIPKQQK